MNPHFELLERAHGYLSNLGQRFVFVGGATVSLHIDDPASGPARATKDVDLVVEVTGYLEFAAIEERLREIGFQQALGEDDTPICRWTKNDLLIDVLPTEPEILGFGASKMVSRRLRECSPVPATYRNDDRGIWAHLSDGR